MSQFNYQITRLSNYQMQRSAVLLSGGLDSAVLLADEAARGGVQPIYVSVGLAWEPAERRMVDALLAAPPLAGRAAPLASLTVDMRDVYAATHWAMEGRPPAYHTPDEDVYLPGRNIVLLSKAGVFCAAAHIGRVVIGTLEHNPFPDATPEFRTTLGRALSLGLAHDLKIDAPFAATSKADVIHRGAALGVPFELTLSCMSPRRNGQLPVVSGQSAEEAEREQPQSGHWPLFTDHDMHCGTCSKCRERHVAFVEAGVPDPTEYASNIHVNE
jgi:7-cyano-7-deazaguanine synthase